MPTSRALLGGSEHCPAHNAITGRCPDLHDAHPAHGHTARPAGMAALAAAKAASCRAAGRAAGSGAGMERAQQEGKQVAEQQGGILANHAHH